MKIGDIHSTGNKEAIFKRANGDAYMVLKGGDTFEATDRYGGVWLTAARNATTLDPNEEVELIRK